MSLYITVDGPSGTGKGAISQWLREYFEKQGSRTVLLKDNELDPLHDYAAKIIPWCKKRGLDPKTFFLPLFAVGYQISEQKIEKALAKYDVVIRDRSFISALAYQTASRVFQPKEIWNLCVSYLHLYVPDCAVIVNCDVDVALERINRRTQKSIGLGGKMSHGRAQHERVSNRFRELLDPDYWPQNLLNICYIYNNDAFSDDLAVVCLHIEAKGKDVVEHLKKTGMIQ